MLGGLKGKKLLIPCLDAIQEELKLRKTAEALQSQALSAVRALQLSFEQTAAIDEASSPESGAAAPRIKPAKESDADAAKKESVTAAAMLQEGEANKTACQQRLHGACKKEIMEAAPSRHVSEDNAAASIASSPAGQHTAASNARK